jgi:hypothetical protein
MGQMLFDEILMMQVEWSERLYQLVGPFGRVRKMVDDDVLLRYVACYPVIS